MTWLIPELGVHPWEPQRWQATLYQAGQTLPGTSLARVTLGKKTFLLQEPQ